MTTRDITERGKAAGIERRAYPVSLQVTRAAASGGPASIEGYASVTEAGYDMWDWAGPYTEVVRAGAFTKTLKENPAVQLLLNHGGLSMAYTKAGTLQLSEDSTGLHMRAEVNPIRNDVTDMLSALEDGAVDEMSFAFRVTRQQWSPDYDQRDIAEVDIHKGDVSVVNYGANPFTDATARGIALPDRRAFGQALVEVRAGATLSAATRATLQTVLDAMGAADGSLDAAETVLADLLGVTVEPDAADAAEMEALAVELEIRRRRALML